jgi:hypothetical protein
MCALKAMDSLYPLLLVVGGAPLTKDLLHLLPLVICKAGTFFGRIFRWHSGRSKVEFASRLVCVWSSSPPPPTLSPSRQN